MGQTSDKFVESDSVDDWGGVYKQSTPSQPTANTDHSPVSCKTDGETNKGFWRRIADDILGQDVTPEFQTNQIFTTFSDPFFPTFCGLESNNDTAQNPVARELDWAVDIQLEDDVFVEGVNFATNGMDEELCETAFLAAVFAETSVQNGLKAEDPEDNLQTLVHSWSDEDIQYPDDPWFNFIDDGGDQIPHLPLTLLSQEVPEDEQIPHLLTSIEVNGQRYEIGKMLGQGSFGLIYEGTRVQDGLKVALKGVCKIEGINQDYINIPGYPDPLPREIGLHFLASRGEYVPVIVQLLDWQDHPDHYVMVLEHPSPCEDMLSFLTDNIGGLTENTAQTIFGQATEAAQICCKRGVFHRDIKLENFLINPNTLEVKLIDFGCSDLLKTSTYTEFMGTEIYFCPEYFETGEYHGKPATVYSLGVLLFTMVFKKYPCDIDLQQIKEKTWSQDGLTEECSNLIQACMEPNPDERIVLEDILDHAWFKVKEPADGLQTPVHFERDDINQYSDDAGSEFIDDEVVQIRHSHSLSQENQEDDEDPNVRIEEINGRQYEVGRMMGKGRLGAVYEGTRVQDGFKVALKVVKKTEGIIQDYINIPGYPIPLPREIGLHVLASRGGYVPVIVKILDWQDRLDHYIMVLEHPSPCEDVMSFVMHKGGSVTENIAQAILGQATEGAQICFKRGVFHRDIKLEKLLINPNTLAVKMIDFGCGDLLKTSTYKKYMGTRIYACPEYLKTGEYHGEAATVYSLGVLLFAMVCGEYPSFLDVHQINEKTWSKDGLTEECCDLIQACLQPNPDERIVLKDILDHAWFEVVNPADNLQTPAHSGSDDDIHYPDDPGFDLIDDRGNQIPSSHSISLSQENQEDDEDPNVRIEEINGYQYEVVRMVDKGGFGADNTGTHVQDAMKVALKFVGRSIIRLVPILLRMI